MKMIESHSKTYNEAKDDAKKKSSDAATTSTTSDVSTPQQK